MDEESIELMQRLNPATASGTEDSLNEHGSSVQGRVFQVKRGHSLAANPMEDLLWDFDTYRALYEQLETRKRGSLAPHLLHIGKEVNQGSRSWTKPDLEDIARWKRMHRLIPRIENAPDIEEGLEHAFKIQDEQARIEALCSIPGVGPVLASAILMFTSPETYGLLDCHAWNALRFLGFQLPEKRVSSGSFTIPELLEFLTIIRRLAKKMTTTPSEVHKALYALEKVRTDKRWSWQRRKAQLDIINSSAGSSGENSNTQLSPSIG
jgi:hypothetical protein